MHACRKGKLNAWEEILAQRHGDVIVSEWDTRSSFLKISIFFKVFSIERSTSFSLSEFGGPFPGLFLNLLKLQLTSLQHQTWPP